MPGLEIDSPSGDSNSKYTLYSRCLHGFLSVQEGGFCHSDAGHQNCDNNPVSRDKRIDSYRLVSSVDFIRNIVWALEASQTLKECPEVLHIIEIK